MRSQPNADVEVNEFQLSNETKTISVTIITKKTLFNYGPGTAVPFTGVYIHKDKTNTFILERTKNADNNVEFFFFYNINKKKKLLILSQLPKIVIN